MKIISRRYLSTRFRSVSIIRARLGARCRVPVLVGSVIALSVVVVLSTVFVAAIECREDLRAIDRLVETHRGLNYEYTYGVDPIKLVVSPAPPPRFWQRAIERIVPSYPTALWLGGTPSDDDCKVIAKLHKMQELEISCCRNITDDGLEALAQLSELRVLKLYMVGKITDAGLRHLASLSKLEKLTIKWALVNANGVRPLRKLKHLKDVDITDIYDRPVR